MQQQQSWLIQTITIKIMIADSEMNHKLKTVMGTMRNLVPDLVNVNMEK